MQHGLSVVSSRSAINGFYILLLLLFFAGSGLFAQVPAGYALAFEDNFNNNKLDTTLWYCRAFSKLASGWNLSENVSVKTVNDTGYLSIKFRKDTDVNSDGQNDFTGGGVISKKTFGYGYYEARIKFYKDTRGLHESFWTHGLGKSFTYSSGDDGYAEAAKKDLEPTENTSTEIDCIELDSKANFGFTNFFFNIRPCNCTTDFGSKPHRNYTNSDLNLGNWVTLGFEWLPGMVVYYLDGVEKQRFTYTTPAFAPTSVWLTALAGYGSDLSTPPVPGAEMKVDYFRYYNKPTWGNLVGNYSFEYNKTNSETVNNWIVNDTVYNNENTDGARVVYDGTAQEGAGYLMQDFKANGSALTVKQNLNYLPNGYYKFTAWVKRSSAAGNANMRVLNYGSARSIALPVTNTWTQVTLNDIHVTTNKLTLAFTTQNGTGGQFIKVDRVELRDTGFGPPATSSLIIDNGDPGYTESGLWDNSSLTGYNNTNTRYSTSPGGYAKWTPDIPATGMYDAYIYRIVNPASDGNSTLTVNYAGGTATLFINDTLTVSSQSGWVYIGCYPFNEGTTGYVQKTKSTSGAFVRADAVAFTKPGSPLSALHPPEMLRTAYAVSAPVTASDEKITSMIYPNPVSNECNVVTQSKKGGLKIITIADLQGRMVWSERRQVSAGYNKRVLDMSHLPPGIYILNVTNDGKTKVQKIVKLDKQ
ncbi:golvesin C-terminal-like domain-containing protein [Chitinophaga sp. RAB17]|uniref:golvesin C-terminal-like domain-containing protein n=1 Tax=Chitinophaga sp. RAB17 TaxID=3233049 RepID=UPI003F90F409